jgi:hypothetical protein
MPRCWSVHRCHAAGVVREVVASDDPLTDAGQAESCERSTGKSIYGQSRKEPLRSTNTVDRRRLLRAAYLPAPSPRVAGSGTDGRYLQRPRQGPSFVTVPHTRHSATGRICRAVTRAIHGSDAAVAEKVHCGLTVPEPAPATAAAPPVRSEPTCHVVSNWSRQRSSRRRCH